VKNRLKKAAFCAKMHVVYVYIGALFCSSGRAARQNSMPRQVSECLEALRTAGLRTGVTISARSEYVFSQPLAVGPAAFGVGTLRRDRLAWAWRVGVRAFPPFDRKNRWMEHPEGGESTVGHPA